MSGVRINSSRRKKNDVKYRLKENKTLEEYFLKSYMCACIYIIHTYIHTCIHPYIGKEEESIYIHKDTHVFMLKVSKLLYVFRYKSQGLK